MRGGAPRLVLGQGLGFRDWLLSFKVLTRCSRVGRAYSTLEPLCGSCRGFDTGCLTTRWATNLSRPPDPGDKFVPDKALQSIFSGQVDYFKEGCSPPSGQEHVEDITQPPGPGNRTTSSLAPE
jgi:hypothetical protein